MSVIYKWNPARLRMWPVYLKCDACSREWSHDDMDKLPENCADCNSNRWNIKSREMWEKALGLVDESELSIKKQISRMTKLADPQAWPRL